MGNWFGSEIPPKESEIKDDDKEEAYNAFKNRNVQNPTKCALFGFVVE